MNNGEGTLPKEWVPSRGRNMESVQLAAAANSQPAGKALPPFIKGSPETPVEHVRAALGTDPFAQAIENALPDKTKFIIHKRATRPSEVIRQRALAVEELERLSGSLGRFKEPWYTCLPEGSPARRINLPLIHMISSTLGYADVHLARDLAAGMPIVGTIPKTNALKDRARGGVTTLGKWKEGIPGRNKVIVERAGKYQEHELAGACWGGTLAGIKAGWLSDPVPIDEIVMRTVPLTPRFAVKGAGGQGKIRLIDDFRASGINDVFQTEDTDVPEGLNALLAISNFYKRVNSAVSLQAFSVDFQHAYKNVPMCRRQGEFAKITTSTKYFSPD